MSGWFLLASAIAQYQRKIKLLKIKIEKKYMSEIGAMVICALCVRFSRVLFIARLYSTASLQYMSKDTTNLAIECMMVYLTGHK